MNKNLKEKYNYVKSFAEIGDYIEYLDISCMGKRTFILNKGENMVFVEKRKWINPKNSKHTSYIREFNLQFNNENSFFLKSIDWDNFTMFMAKRKPDALMVLEYPN